MAGPRSKSRDGVAKAKNLAPEPVTAAMEQGKEAVDRVEDQARQVAGRRMLREAPYAGLGLGHVVVESARNLDASSLPERLRRTPVAVASKVNSLGTNAKATYLALAARGRSLRLQAAGDQVTDDVAEQLGAAASRAEAAAAATLEGAGQAADRAGDTAEATAGRVKGLAGKLRGVATRTAKTTGESTDATATAQGPVTSAPDTGTGPLEQRTVAQLRDRASELGIEGRAKMKKRELIRAIRDAM